MLCFIFQIAFTKLSTKLHLTYMASDGILILPSINRHQNFIKHSSADFLIIKPPSKLQFFLRLLIFFQKPSSLQIWRTFYTYFFLAVCKRVLMKCWWRFHKGKTKSAASVNIRWRFDEGNWYTLMNDSCWFLKLVFLQEEETHWCNLGKINILTNSVKKNYWYKQKWVVGLVLRRGGELVIDGLQNHDPPKINSRVEETGTC